MGNCVFLIGLWVLFWKIFSFKIGRFCYLFKIFVVSVLVEVLDYCDLVVFCLDIENFCEDVLK